LIDGIQSKDLNVADWSTYVVDRLFKSLSNAFFPEGQGNSYIKGRANTVILSEKVGLL
jgi:hypothetical protein